MTARILLRGTLVALTLGIAASAAQSAETDYSNPHLLRSPDALAARAETSPVDGRVTYGADLVLIDVRPNADFEKGHIPGARQLEPDAVSDPDSPVAGALRSEAAIAELLGDLGVSAKTEVVLYDDKGGFHAARVFWVLEYLGHRKVSVLNGGLQNWTAAGKALDIGAADDASASSGTVRFAPAITPRRYASADWILERQNDPNTLVIDVRPDKLYAKGHIPWAKNVPWSQNLNADKTLKSAAALRGHFEAQGITPDRNIVVHCQNGLASAHSYFALRLLGYPQVRTYHRSWSEWGAAEDLPKAASGDG